MAADTISRCTCVYSITFEIATTSNTHAFVDHPFRFSTQVFEKIYTFTAILRPIMCHPYGDIMWQVLYATFDYRLSLQGPRTFRSTCLGIREHLINIRFSHLKKIHEGLSDHLNLYVILYETKLGQGPYISVSSNIFSHIGTYILVLPFQYCLRIYI